MRIVALVENTSDGKMKPVHGVSFYIETNNHKILFDVGPDDTLFQNADKKNINLQDVDTVIISHGHSDHGGALKHFLEINKTAKVYVQKSAFEKHYSKVLFFKFNVGINPSLMENPNVILLDGDMRIDDELFLFTAKTKGRIQSEANKSLFTDNGPDDFRPEQNLLISENKKVLLMGCGHSGVVNILENSKERPNYCIGGFHVYNPFSRRTVSDDQLDNMADELTDYDDIVFFTCHCTGKKAFNYLSGRFENIKYISCGNELVI